MTCCVTSATASAAPPARRSRRRWTFDFRGGQTDHDVVAGVELALDDLRKTAVADSGPDRHGLQLLVRSEEVDLLLARGAFASGEVPRGAGETAATLSALRGAAFEAAAAGTVPTLAGGRLEAECGVGDAQHVAHRGRIDRHVRRHLRPQPLLRIRHFDDDGI